eukprot:jgi/Mesvir1/3459/Mv11952-RA.2
MATPGRLIPWQQAAVRLHLSLACPSPPPVLQPRRQAPVSPTLLNQKDDEGVSRHGAEENSTSDTGGLSGGAGGGPVASSPTQPWAMGIGPSTTGSGQKTHLANGPPAWGSRPLPVGVRTPGHPGNSISNTTHPGNATQVPPSLCVPASASGLREGDPSPETMEGQPPFEGVKGSPSSEGFPAHGCRGKPEGWGEREGVAATSPVSTAVASTRGPVPGGWASMAWSAATCNAVLRRLAAEGRLEVLRRALRAACARKVADEGSYCIMLAAHVLGLGAERGLGAAIPALLLSGAGQGDTLARVFSSVIADGLAHGRLDAGASLLLLDKMEKLVMRKPASHSKGAAFSHRPGATVHTPVVHSAALFSHARGEAAPMGESLLQNAAPFLPPGPDQAVVAGGTRVALGTVDDREFSDREYSDRGALQDQRLRMVGLRESSSGSMLVAADPCVPGDPMVVAAGAYLSVAEALAHRGDKEGALAVLARAEGWGLGPLTQGHPLARSVKGGGAREGGPGSTGSPGVNSAGSGADPKCVAQKASPAGRHDSNELDSNELNSNELDSNDRHVVASGVGSWGVLPVREDGKSPARHDSTLGGARSRRAGVQGQVGEGTQDVVILASRLNALSAEACSSSTQGGRIITTHARSFSRPFHALATPGTDIPPGRPWGSCDEQDTVFWAAAARGMSLPGEGAGEEGGAPGTATWQQPHCASGCCSPVVDAAGGTIHAAGNGVVRTTAVRPRVPGWSWWPPPGFCPHPGDGSRDAAPEQAARGGASSHDGGLRGAAWDQSTRGRPLLFQASAGVPEESQAMRAGAGFGEARSGVEGLGGGMGAERKGNVRHGGVDGETCAGTDGGISGRGGGMDGGVPLMGGGMPGRVAERAGNQGPGDLWDEPAGDDGPGEFTAVPPLNTERRASTTWRRQQWMRGSEWAGVPWLLRRARGKATLHGARSPHAVLRRRVSGGSIK